MAAPVTKSAHDGIPAEIQDRLDTFDSRLTEVENKIKEIMATPLSEIHEQITLVEKAKVDLIMAYTINSLFWTFLVARGENAREHPVKQELARIQAYMKRAKDIEQDLKDKEGALRVDRAAAKRIVAGSLGSQLREDENQRQQQQQAQTSQQAETVAKAKKNLWKKAHQKTAPDPPPVVSTSTESMTSPGDKRKSESSTPQAGGKRKKKR